MIPDSRSERVELGERSTDIYLGSGILADLWASVRAHFPKAARCGLAIDERVAGLQPLPSAPADLELLAVRLPEGEAAKTREVLSLLQDTWIGLRRDEPIVVIGGGAALDVGGFAAATVRRGLPWVAVATSVVAMADAAVGGKTAINHERGKNLLGAFHPPTLVISDVATLATLDPRERTAGLAELYKCARIDATGLLARLREGPPGDPAAWLEVIHAAVAIKARLVESDERDVGARRLLNYGHTVGHALERVLGNARMRHGEAVAIGMDVAARIAVMRGLLTESERAEQRADLERLGLPVAVPADCDAGALATALGFDKKRAAGTAHVLALPVGTLPVGTLPVGTLPVGARPAETLGVQMVEDVSDAEISAALTS